MAGELGPVSILGPFEGIRLVHIADFGGPGNDSLSLAAVDVFSAGPAAAAAALRAALGTLPPRAPRGLQLGCLPLECQIEAQAAVEEALPGLAFMCQLGRARAFAAPAGPARSAVPSPAAAAAAARAERVDHAAHELRPWLAEALRGRYPEPYVRALVGSEVVAPPVVLLDAGGRSVAHVLQELADLSVGALFVEEALRRQGVGAWLPRSWASSWPALACARSPWRRSAARPAWACTPAQAGSLVPASWCGWRSQRRQRPHMRRNKLRSKCVLTACSRILQVRSGVWNLVGSAEWRDYDLPRRRSQWRP
ncbi:unnamed protein product [Prorocentrum cordatum]|uniref:N-acetyltransferase domain-containing protein n=1 Tax=Prorocentrum cordatum TaxID=2364126 RepID=A0ABN9UVF0_9DINO|nr:unnamed protein product [Polarella glacialis]